MTQSQTEKKTTVLWNFFSSPRLTIFLLIILALASILGTFIPQRENAIEFSRNLDPRVFELFKYLDLFDVYHSLWFRILIALLGLNLIVCSIDRFPGAWKRFRAQPKADREKPFEKTEPGQDLFIPIDLDKAADLVGGFLKSRYKRVHSKAGGGKRFFYAEKGRYAHFGVYLVHLSVLVILSGGLIGSIFGFQGYVRIVEGEKVNTIILRQEMKPLNLGFEVRCDNFEVEFYKNGTPKEYRSELTFLKHGEEVKTDSLLVNHPLKFQGIRFYQSNYGRIPGDKVRLKIQWRGNKKKSTLIDTRVDESNQLPGGNGRFKVAEVKGNLMGMMGPAALISITSPDGEETEFWVFQNVEEVKRRFLGILAHFPKLDPAAFEPYTFFLKDLETKFYTGLQVNKDPGVPIVWTGFFLLIAGFMVTFFSSHRRMWIRLSIEGKDTRISFAGIASKNPVGMEREVKYLKHTIRDLLEKP